jgi:hypothetical protein
MRLALILLLFGCDPGRPGNPGPGSDLRSVLDDMGGAITDFPPPYDNAVVYAHSASQLYKIDPDSLSITLIGTFNFPVFGEQMTDIAVDPTGKMVGISFNNVYSIDTANAACTHLAALDRQLNGLSFLPTTADPLGPTKLVGAAKDDGSFYEIDPMTGKSKVIGAYGNTITSSGDIVSVTGFGTVATVRQGASGNDFLARIDPATGAATLIGDVGRVNVWGLGFWKGRVFGFSSVQGFMTIDPTTGKGTTVPGGDTVSWYGAGVTTSAPPIQ